MDQIYWNYIFAGMSGYGISMIYHLDILKKEENKLEELISKLNPLIRTLDNMLKDKDIVITEDDTKSNREEVKWYFSQLKSFNDNLRAYLSDKLVDKSVSVDEDTERTQYPVNFLSRTLNDLNEALEKRILSE